MKEFSLKGLNQAPTSIESIRFQQLSFAHESTLVLANNNSPSKLLFDHLNYEFMSGRCYWLRGLPGSGKSTLLRILVGLCFPTGGDFLINNLSVKEMSFEEFLPYRLKIGYSFDMGGLISNRTLFDNLMLPLTYHHFMPYKEAKEWVEHLGEEFAISSVMQLRPSRVSGSNKKAAVVARSLVLKPSVLVLDDPTTGLSESRVNKLIEILRQGIRDGLFKYVFVVSEDRNFTSSMNCFCLELKNQKLIIEDPHLQ